jgi:hypothetical protein
MAVNRDKPGRWKAAVAQSVDMYSDWFMKFAPKAFRETRIQTTKDVEATLHSTGNLTNIQPATIRKHPEILPTLRMSTCPPLAVDRLIGLARVSTNIVKCMELEKKLPARMSAAAVDAELARVAAIIEKMADPDIFIWLSRKDQPATETELHRAPPSSRTGSAARWRTLSSATPRRSGNSWLSRHGLRLAATSRFQAATESSSTQCRPAPSASA